MNYEYRIKRMRNIIKRYENGSMTIGDLVDVIEHIKEQVTA